MNVLTSSHILRQRIERIADANKIAISRYAVQQIALLLKLKQRERGWSYLMDADIALAIHAYYNERAYG